MVVLPTDRQIDLEALVKGINRLTSTSNEVVVKGALLVGVCRDDGGYHFVLAMEYAGGMVAVPRIIAGDVVDLLVETGLSS